MIGLSQSDAKVRLFVLQVNRLDENKFVLIRYIYEPNLYGYAVQKKICKILVMEEFVVSDGGLSTVDANGGLRGFLCFD